MDWRSILLGSVVAIQIGSTSSAAAAPQVADTFAPDAMAPADVTDKFDKSIKEQFDAKLKDPYSAVYEFRPLKRGSCKSGWFGRGPRLYGWVLEFSVNSKNSLGAYVGADPYTVIWYDTSGDVTSWDGYNFGIMGHGACRFESYVAASPAKPPPTTP